MSVVDQDREEQRLAALDALPAESDAPSAFCRMCGVDHDVTDTCERGAA